MLLQCLMSLKNNLLQVEATEQTCTSLEHDSHNAYVGGCLFCPCHDELALLVESSIMEAVVRENLVYPWNKCRSFYWTTVAVKAVVGGAPWWKLRRSLEVLTLAINDQGSNLL